MRLAYKSRLECLGIRSAVPRMRPVKIIDDIPKDVLLGWSVKLYTLMNIAWGYVETILDLCILMRIHDTKPLVRKIRELKRDYDRFRAKSIDADFERKEAERGERFEDEFNKDFTRLFNGIEFEVNKLGLEENYKYLLIAVHQALTIMDVVRLYARWCDAEIKKRGIWTTDCCMIQKEFLALYPLIPQFAGDCYKSHIEARKLSAGILFNRMMQIEIITNSDEE